MNMAKEYMKRFVKDFLYNAIRINPSIRRWLKPLSPVIPNRIFSILPALCKFHVDLPDGRNLVLEELYGQDIIARNLYWRGFRGHEYETAKLFYALAKRARIIFDIGASIGYFSLLAASASKNSEIYAFEPVVRVYNLLKHNIELNEFPNVVALPVAVTDFDGNATLYVPKVDLPFSASMLKDFLKDFRGYMEEVVVPAITLDTFANGKNVDLMKIDTEATEHRVLKGGQSIIENNEPIIICEVLKGRIEKYLEQFFSRLGRRYDYYLITEGGIFQRDSIQGDSKWRNYLLCTKKRLADVEIAVNDINTIEKSPVQFNLMRNDQYLV